MKRVVVVGLVLVGMLMVSSSEAMAESKIAFPCNDGSGVTQVCLMNADGSGGAILTNFAVSFYTLSLDFSPDGTQVLAAGFHDAVKHFYVVDVDGSSVVEIVPSLSIGDKLAMEAVAWSPELPPSVATLTPTNQTITVFLLGMIASALIMRGRSAKEAS